MGSVFPVLFRKASSYRTSRRVIWYISARMHSAVSQKTVAITVNDCKHKISQIPFLFLPIPFWQNTRMEWNDVRDVSVLRDECVRRMSRGDYSGVGRRRYKHTDIWGMKGDVCFCHEFFAVWISHLGGRKNERKEASKEARKCGLNCCPCIMNLAARLYKYFIIYGKRDECKYEIQEPTGEVVMITLQKL